MMVLRFTLILILFLAFADASPEPQALFDRPVVKFVKSLPGQQARSSRPDCMAQIGNHIYFQADDGIHGNELWRTDGSPTGTYMIKDLLPWRDSEPCHFHELNGKIVFSAEGPNDKGQELWITDGTSEGTHFIKELFPGRAGSRPEPLGIVNGRLLLRTGNLWSTDGTADGTAMVSSIYLPNSGAITLNGLVYFTGYTREKGYELYRSDGTESGTKLVKDINPGKKSSSAGPNISYNNFLYFIARDSTHGRQLWKSDGTNSGASRITNIPSGKVDSVQCCLSDGLIFSVEKTSVTELWKTNGFSAAKKIVDLRENINFMFLGALRNEIYFRVWTTGLGTELWKINGTAEGTVLVKDLTPGPDDSHPSDFISNNESAFFLASGPGAFTIWKTDGTSNGTIQLGDNAAWGNSVNSFQRLSDMVIFNGSQESTGIELWKADSTGSSLIRDIGQGFKSSEPYSLTAAANKLFFLTNPNFRLWVSDGSELGTRFLQQFNITGERIDTIYGEELIGTKDYLFGTLATPLLGNSAIWRSDGTQEGTIVLLRGTGNFRVDSLTKLQNLVLFAASDEEHGRELWRTDGTPEGTFLVKDLLAGPQGSNVSSLVNWKGSIYFVATNQNRRFDLWKTNGTRDGTIRIVEVPAYTEIIPAENYLYLFGDNHARVSNGTASGTKTFSNFFGLSDIEKPTANKDYLIFAARKDGVGKELWVINPIERNILQLADINLGEEGSFPSQLKSWNGITYFSAKSSAFGKELWRTDGTPSGTFQLKDIVPGQPSSDPGSFYPFGKFLYFRARDVHGTELWRTDGTANGTELYKDINIGLASSGPRNFTQVGSKLFFTVTDRRNGSELWVLENSKR